jgi:glycine cleavage system H protein
MPRYFTKDHEWIDYDDEDTGTVGITDYAQGQLGDITFVEVPDVGRAVSKEEAVAVVESVKAASDIYAPASGVVAHVNEALTDAPELVNTAAETEGWLFKITLTDQLELGTLMDKVTYDNYVAGL